MMEYSWRITEAGVLPLSSGSVLVLVFGFAAQNLQCGYPCSWLVYDVQHSIQGAF